MKKLIVCLAILVVASYAQAASDVVIGSWESQTNEGWYDWKTAELNGYNPEPGAWIDDVAQQTMPLAANNQYGYEFSWDWSTDGDASLKVAVQGASGDNGWGNRLAVSVMNDWLDNTQLSFDITSDGDWAQIVCINMNAASTENGFKTMIGDWATPLWSSGGSNHVVIDTTAFRGAGWAQAGDGHMNIVFQVQGATGAHLFLDNVQLTVPEPATMSLLGLGGLALLRRRK